MSSEPRNARRNLTYNNRELGYCIFSRSMIIFPGLRSILFIFRALLASLVGQKLSFDSQVTSHDTSDQVAN